MNKQLSKKFTFFRLNPQSVVKVLCPVDCLFICMSEKGRRYLKALGKGAKLKSKATSSSELAPRYPNGSDASIFWGGSDISSFSDIMASESSRHPHVLTSTEVSVASKDRALPHPISTSGVEISGSRDWE